MNDRDHALLRKFRTERDESAFQQLVERHLGMVFGVAFRVTGNREQAEEVAQTTFATLAGKSVEIGADAIIAGWLYQTARTLALMALRSEHRRRQREQIAAAMNLHEPSPNILAEHLDSAMDELKPEDRDALVLRFFEDRNLRDVGSELGLSEDAARMRVNRALEKLRSILGKAGIAGSATWLLATLPSSATAAVPAGLAATITTTVLAGTAIATTTVTTMNLFNLKTAAAVVAAAAVTGTSTYLVKEQEAEQLRTDNQALTQNYAGLTADQQQALATIQLRDEQIAALRKEVTDLPRLREDVDRLNRQLVELDKVKSEYDELRNLTLPDNSEIDQLYSKLHGTRVFQAKAAYLRTLLEAMLMAADKNNGIFPDSIEAAKPFMDHFYGDPAPLVIHVRADDFQVCYSGKLSDIKDPNNTVVLREIDTEDILTRNNPRLAIFANGSIGGADSQ